MRKILAFTLCYIAIHIVFLGLFGYGLSGLEYLYTPPLAIGFTAAVSWGIKTTGEILSTDN